MTRKASTTGRGVGKTRRLGKTTQRVSETVPLRLDYYVGKDEPARGVYRNAVVRPKYTRELLIAIRNDAEPFSDKPFNALTDPPQVHLVGTARALEELGRYLVALGRLKTADPEPYGWFDNVRNADGGRARLLPRRVSSIPLRRRRTLAPRK